MISEEERASRHLDAPADILEEGAVRSLPMLETERLVFELAQRTSELDAARSDLETLLHSVSHDLKAPLRSIKGHCELLLQQPFNTSSEETSRYLQAIARGSDRLTQLLNDLVRYSRASQTQMKPVTIRVGLLVGRLLRELDGEIGARTVEVAIGDEMRLAGDKELLREAVKILLSNAIKFTSHRQDPQIEIVGKPQGSEIELYVRDNGVGFDGAYASRLFKPFERLHSMTEFSGSGLGLATLAKIVSRHGGRFWAEGAEGSGATVHFTIPTIRA